ncbi:MAG: ABC transporter permease [Chloroflexi bacterium]|nr:ABC transporter permease [Chloroflexota bacterium]
MSRREMLREFLATWPGRIGTFALAVLVVVSIVAIATFPTDFGKAKWSNPAVWADNPKSAPPAWSNIFTGNDQLRHEKLKAERPGKVEASDGLEVRSYVMPYSFPAHKPPKFLSVSIGGVTFHERPPTLSVHILRPDGSEAALNREAVRGPRDGESAPYSRFKDEPLRVALTSEPAAVDALREMYLDTYGADIRSSDLRQVMNRALFGKPSESKPGEIALLKGRYELIVKATLYDGRDSVDFSRFVVGGTTFGLMGTDGQGRDLAQGLIFGLPVALIIGIIAAVMTTLIGAGLGILGGYVGGKTDMVIQRFADIVNNVPLLPLLIFFVFIVGSHLYLILLFLVAFSWPGLTILLRSMVLQIRSGQLIESSIAMGASKWRIMYRHIFPQMAPFIISQLIFLVPAAILAEAGLSFLGLGDPSIPTWGQILENGFRTGAVYLAYWWWVIPPGVLIIITAVTFMLIALGLEPVVNPRLRKVR